MLSVHTACARCLCTLLVHAGCTWCLRIPHTMSCSARDLLAQELALKLRAEGKTYKPQKAKKSSVKAEAASAPFRTLLSSQPHQQATQNAQQQPQGSQQQSNAPQREETGTRPEGDVQVTHSYITSGAYHDSNSMSSFGKHLLSVCQWMICCSQ